MVTLEDLPRLPEAQNILPINPAILSGHAASEAGRPQRVISESDVATAGGQGTACASPGPLAPDPQLTPEHHCSVSEEVGLLCQDTINYTTDFWQPGPSATTLKRHSDRSDSIHPDGHDNTDSDREVSKADRRSSQTKELARRPSKRPRTGTAPHEGGGSFLTLRSHFLTSSVDERLQFLSWLFEGALPRCISGSPSALNLSSRTENIGRNEVQLVRYQRQPHKAAQTLDGNNDPLVHSRKGMPWSVEEAGLLMELRKEQNLPVQRWQSALQNNFQGELKGPSRYIGVRNSRLNSELARRVKRLCSRKDQKIGHRFTIMSRQSSKPYERIMSISLCYK